LLAILGQASCASRQSLGLEIANPEDIGVTWQECTISQGFDWQQAESCFGHSMPLWDESEKGKLVYNRFCKIQHLKKSRSGYP
jgi:hypothetical protein